MQKPLKSDVVLTLGQLLAFINSGLFTWNRKVQPPSTGLSRVANRTITQKKVAKPKCSQALKL